MQLEEQVILTSATHQEHRAFWKAVSEQGGTLFNHPFEGCFKPWDKHTITPVVHEAQVDTDISLKLGKLVNNDLNGIFTLFASGIFIWMYKYSGSEHNLAFKTPFYHPGSDGKQGSGQLIPVLANLSNEQTVRELLEQVGTQLRKVYRYQQFPFEKLFQQDSGASFLPDLKVVVSCAQLHATAEECNADLHVALDLSPETFRVKITFLRTLDDPALGKQLLDHLLAIMQQIPETRLTVADVDMLSAEEHELYEHILSGEERNWPLDSTLFALLKTRMEQFPEQVAVYDPRTGEKLTYRELDQRSAALASSLLTEWKVQPEDYVCVMIERSIDYVMAVVAVARSGAAYMPVDTNIPADRLRYQVNKVGAKGILLHKRSADKARSLGVPIFEVDTQWGELPANMEPIEGHAGPRDAAYVIFTSGSTGVPKGVVIEHRSALNLVYFCAEAYAMDHHTKGTLYSSTGFDASVWEIWPCLCNAGSLVIVPDEDRLDPEALLRLLKTHDITHSFLPPVLTDQLVMVAPDDLELKTLIQPSGEAMHLRKETKLRIVNVYGITEATAICTLWFVEEHPEVTGLLPIGRPHPNVRAYILDKNLRPVPKGAFGELCIGGVSVGRGYHGEPALTAERFVQHPLTGQPILKTGDRCRWMPDGNIAYSGRFDHQVQVRGNRIEPAEIERQLQKLEGVEKAVVLPEEKPGEETVLYAYLAAGKVYEREALNRHLKQFLPDYMVPREYYFMKEIPLTVNGKVDRRRLSQKRAEDMQPATLRHTGPRNQLEQQLLAIWLEELGRKDLGVTDNFFAWGGHSVKAMKVMARIRQELGYDIEFKSVFENATVEEMARYLEQLKPVSMEDIGLAEHRLHYPLSPAQTRFWFLDHLENGHATRNLPVAFKFNGNIDLQKLREAIAQVVTRHESLRTVFPVIDVEPRQVIEPFDPDLHGLQVIHLEEDPAAFEKQARLCDELAQAPFSLEQGPLFRIYWFAMPGRKGVLLLVVHHIVCDGWSLDLVIKEVTECYKALVLGLPMPLLPLRFQFKDVVMHRLDRARSAEPGNDKEFWATQLQGAAPRIELPYFQRENAPATRIGHIETDELDRETFENMRKLAGMYNCTPFMALLAMLKVLFLRAGGQRDISIGTPVSGRDLAGLHDQVGLYVNTLVLRSRLDPEQTFATTLQQVRNTVLEAQEHSAYPFEQLVEDLSAGQDRRNPLFNIMIAYQDTGVEQVSQWHGDVQVAPLELANTASWFDLNIHFREQHGALHIWVQHDLGVMSSRQVKKLLTHFREVLRSAVDAPEQKLGRLKWYPDEERYETVVSFNPNPALKAEYPSVVHLFRETASAFALKEAVCYKELMINYKDLNVFSDCLAYHLVNERGVKRGEVVACRAERTSLLPVAILGIIKSGAVYLPLDTSHPETRINQLLEDAGVSLVVSVSDTAPAAHIPVVHVPEIIAGRNHTEAPQIEIGSEDPAYLIYTSGSTGKPKGVLVSHGSLINYCLWAQQRFRFSPDDRSMLLSTPAFDGVYTSIWGTLLHGGRLEVLDKQEASDPALLTQRIATSGITFLKITPSLLNAILKASETGLDWPSLRLAIIGGEQLHARDVEQLRQWCPGLEIHNHYGPTEATIGITCAEIRGDKPVVAACIGTPVANGQVYILDPYGEPLPPGFEGEIYLAGVPLAMCYYNHPELTAERFVPLYFEETGAFRAYKTGDRGRWSEEGKLMFAGRKDRQVKVRGYRVELSEVEAGLRALTGIKHVVVTNEQAGDEWQLVAYAVAAEPDAETLREQAAQILPEYMIPAAWVFVDEMPVTSNGKTDMVALQAQRRHQAAKTSPSAPLTVWEQRLAVLWEELLNTHGIGRFDNFFAVGGHSLSATRLVTALKKQYGISLPLRGIFDHPQLSRMADEVNKLQSKAFGQIAPAPSAESYPLAQPQMGIWINLQFEEGSHAYVNHYVFELLGKLDPGVLEQALKAIAARHEILRTAIVETPEGPRQVVLESMEDTFLYILEGVTDPEEVLNAEQNRELDLAHGPLFRCNLIPQGIDRAILHFSIHHIICDAWSFRILTGELFSACAAIAKGLEWSGRPLPIMYKDFALWQASPEREQLRQRNRAYWHTQLAGPLPVLDLPTDRPREGIRTTRGDLCRFPIAADESFGLRRLAARQGATLYMALLSLVNMLLHKYTGATDIVTGSPVAGRDHPDLEDMVGLFAHTMVMRISVRPETTFRDYLAHVCNTALDAYEHQDYPFHFLLEELDVKRDPTRSALFDVVVVLQNAEWNAGGRASDIDLQVNRYERGYFSSKLDLTFAFQESGGEISAAIEYNSDLFNRSTIEKMSEHFMELLRGVLEDPDKPVGEYALEHSLLQTRNSFDDDSIVEFLF